MSSPKLAGLIYHVLLKRNFPTSTCAYVIMWLRMYSVKREVVGVRHISGNDGRYPKKYIATKDIYYNRNGFNDGFM